MIACVMDELCQDAIQIVVLGTGQEQYENMFRHFAWKYPDKVSANIFYSEELSHKIYAACDKYISLEETPSGRRGSFPSRSPFSER